MVVPMQNNAATHTLSAQVTTLGTIVSVPTGTATNQTPPKPLEASVQPNTGQLAYTYPITVAPGPNGTTPTVQLTYSSAATNARHEPTSPTDSPGEGWGLSLGSISASTYPSGSAATGTWYFLNGVDNVSDRLIPVTSGSSSYYTEHVSRLKIQRATSQKTGQPCFNVWDTAGNYSEYGCTTDSLQYSIDSSGARTNYRWDLDLVVPTNEGNSTSNRFISLVYQQEKIPVGSYMTVRDAVLRQITYGTGSSGSALAGTVDFLYKGVANYSSGGIQWVSAYGTNEGGCTPPGNPNTTTLRCDDPVNYPGGLTAPTVMSTYTLKTINSYVGDDSSSSHLDYSYSLSTSDTAYHQCTDGHTGATAWCAGRHVLNSITPSVYQNGTGSALPAVTFQYQGLGNNYIDTSQTMSYGKYGSNNFWQYLHAFSDHSTGMTEFITYLTGDNNTHGTPNTGTDNRFDPTYCTIQGGCSGTFANQDDHAWSEQLVNTITIAPTDTNFSSLPSAETTYSYGMATQSGATCSADSAGLTACPVDTWYPSGENDWQDYYHGEFRGFSWVYIVSPAGDLTTQNYASTPGWGTAPNRSANYTAGQLYEQDLYQGPDNNPALLISRTSNTYGGNNGTNPTCYSDSSYTVYVPCETMLTSSRTTDYEQTGSGNANAPWVEHDDTYDDYSTSGSGLSNSPQSPATGAYHNLQQEVISSSNAPTVTKKWTYYTTDSKVNGQTFYNVHQVAHSELDDASGHAWSCHDITYDEGAPSGVPQPAAGWPTTTQDYSNCGNHAAGKTLTSHVGYESSGQVVATVDAVATTNPALYSGAGCTLTTAPAILSGNWGEGYYTSCAVYDGQSGLPTKQTNAFGQTSTTSYDATQGQVPTSTKDVNGQTTTLAYTYPGGNPLVQTNFSVESTSSTAQSQTVSTCTDNSLVPCLQEDSSTSLYSSAVTRTFYDAMGRATEVLAPASDSAHTIFSFTTYNDAAHTVFSSQPTTIASTSSWVDPSTYTSVAGTTSTLDPAGRTLSVQDALGKSSTAAYGLGTQSGDSHTYVTTTSTDANGHVSVTYTDALGRTVYAQSDNGKAGGTLSPASLATAQYNALDLPTSVAVKDLAPQTGESITSVTATMQYDDLGRLTTLSDPDRGTHSYTYDGDSRLVADVSGTRTLGASYDLLGRVGCLQDAVVTPDQHGACTSGANPFVKNTYDADPGGVTWSGTNYAVGRLTQSVAVNYLPSPANTQGSVTQNMQYDARGQLITNRMGIATSGGSLSFPTLPQYQQALSYNDAGQLTTTQTTVGGQAGYTFTQAYDSTTSALKGLSNNNTGVANLATLGYNSQDLVGSINDLTTSGTALASNTFSYDGDLRPSGNSATWQAGGSIANESLAYDAVGNVVSRATTQAAIPGQSGSGGSDTQNYCYDEQNRLVWAANNGTIPSAGNGTCGSATMSSTLGGNYTAKYAYTNLGQLWQGPQNGTGTQEQYLYCDSSHPHQLSNLSQVSSSPTCTSKGTIDYTGSYDAWGNTIS